MGTGKVGKVRNVEAEQAWLGVVWCGGSGRIRQGSAGTAIGMAGSVTAGIGEYRQAWLGSARCGGDGSARYGRT